VRLTRLPVVVGTEDKNITCCGANRLKAKNASHTRGSPFHAKGKVLKQTNYVVMRKTLNLSFYHKQEKN
jgi:hypothetical protein